MQEGGNAPQSSIVWEGYLEKKGKGESVFGKKNWKKRYFVLEGESFSYYRDKGSALLNAIPLHNPDRVEECEEIPKDPKHPYTFKLFTVKRTLLMSADTEEIRQTLIRELTKQIKKSANYLLSERY